MKYLAISLITTAILLCGCSTIKQSEKVKEGNLKFVIVEYAPNLTMKAHVGAAPKHDKGVYTYLYEHSDPTMTLYGDQAAISFSKEPNSEKRTTIWVPTSRLYSYIWKD